jgi:CCR4-NOT transcription complex subunit 9
MASLSVASSSVGMVGTINMDELLKQLLAPSTREGALADLSRNREGIPDLGLQLWRTPGVVAVLLHEVVSVYSLLSPPTISSQASTRVCNALALMQCIASHADTKGPFLQAQMPLYLYPCLNATHKGRPFEYLRLTCLGVIGALVKNESPDVIDFLLSTEIVPLCLRIMDSGNELSRTVAIFIVQKILLDDAGLNYICQTYERFFAVTTVLSSMTLQLVDQRSLRLVKHVIRCYLRLADNKKALEGLRQILPEPFKQGVFNDLIKDDPSTVQFYTDLMAQISSRD